MCRQISSHLVRYFPPCICPISMVHILTLQYETQRCRKANITQSKQKCWECNKEHNCFFLLLKDFKMHPPPRKKQLHETRLLKLQYITLLWALSEGIMKGSQLLQTSSSSLIAGCRVWRGDWREGERGVQRVRSRGSTGQRVALCSRSQVHSRLINQSPHLSSVLVARLCWALAILKGNLVELIISSLRLLPLWHVSVFAVKIVSVSNQ